MVAVAELIFVLVLGADDCLFAWRPLPRLLSTGADCLAAGVFAITDPVSQRQSRRDGLDRQPQSPLPGAKSCAAFPYGRRGAVVCWAVDPGHQCCGALGGIALVEPRTPPHPFLDLTQLINLLSWLPGHSGFGSYVQRVVPGLDGLRLQLGEDSEGTLFTPEQWSTKPPALASGRLMRFLQRYSLVQHGLDLTALLQRDGIKLNQVETIYSPFFDALLCWPEVPQLITCHDLTPLVASNSRKAWLRYRLWQPRHCRVATRLIAISRYVADQLVEFGVEHDRIEVIPNGIEICRPPVLTPFSQDLVALARHDVNKNLPALFRGIDQLQRQWPQWSGTLRIIGRGGRQTSLVQRLRNALPRPDQVELINALSHAELLAVIRSSMALLSASVEEGFDYPVLEAKAEGIPTLISDIPVHREFHSESSLFFALDDDGVALARRVIDLCQESVLWRQLSLRGLELVRSLSVERQVEAISAQIRALALLR